MRDIVARAANSVETDQRARDLSGNRSPRIIDFQSLSRSCSWYIQNLLEYIIDLVRLNSYVSGFIHVVVWFDLLKIIVLLDEFKSFRSRSTVKSIWSTLLIWLYMIAYCCFISLYAHILLPVYVTCDENKSSVLFCSILSVRTSYIIRYV